MSLILSKDKYQCFINQSKAYLNTCVKYLACLQVSKSNRRKLFFKQFFIKNNLIIKKKIKDANHYRIFASTISLFMSFADCMMWKCFQNKNRRKDFVLNGNSKPIFISLGSNQFRTVFKAQALFKFRSEMI
jgi:hypothetical protein